MNDFSRPTDQITNGLNVELLGFAGLTNDLIHKQGRHRSAPVPVTTLKL